MQKYVDQLVETLREACGNHPGPRYIEMEGQDECLRDIIDMEMSMEEEEKTLEHIFGVPKASFPPEDRLSDEQIRQLIQGILELWRAFHYEADFRKGEFTEREQYTKLVGEWVESHPFFRGAEGTWHIEMFDYTKKLVVWTTQRFILPNKTSFFGILCSIYHQLLCMLNWDEDKGCYIPDAESTDAEAQ